MQTSKASDESPDLDSLKASLTIPEVTQIRSVPGPSTLDQETATALQFSQRKSLQRMQGFQLVDLLCAFACSAAFSYWMLDLTGNISIGAVLFFLIVPFSISSLGYGLLQLIRWEFSQGCSFPLAFIVGATLTSVALLAGDFLSNYSLTTGWVAVLAVGLAMQYFGPAPKVRESSLPRRVCTVSSVLFCLVAATLWTQSFRPSFVPLNDAVAYRPFSDYFVHAQLASQLAQKANLLALGNPNISGAATPFYHYACYVFPASFSVWTGESAFSAWAAFGAPLGVFVLGLSAFSLASAWWQEASGLAALIGLLLVPDPSFYGFHQWWYSFHRLTIISPGLMYGLGGVAAAIALMTRPGHESSCRAIVAGAGLIAATAMIKAHFLLVATPIVVFWVILFRANWTRRKRFVFLCLAVGIGALGCYTMDRLAIGPNLWPRPGQQGVSRYLSIVASVVPPGRGKDFFAPLANGSVSRHPILALLLVTGGTLGAYLLIGPAMYLVAGLRKRLSAKDAVPAVGVFVVLCFAFLAPANMRDGVMDELWHRPFVLSYFLMVVWCWGMLVALLPAEGTPAAKFIPATLLLAGLVLLVVPLRLGPGIQDTKSTYREDRYGTNQPFAKGRLECAAFLRKHTGELDVVQEGELALYPVLGGLAERRCFLGFDPVTLRDFAAHMPIYAELARRSEQLAELQSLTTRADLERVAGSLGLTWYISNSDDSLKWPSEILQRPAFQSGNYKVFDLRPAAR